jgi:iron complex outermembrane recepter protein
MKLDSHSNKGSSARAGQRSRRGAFASLPLSAMAVAVLTATAPVTMAQEEGLSLEEVLVTARKREESLQDVPGAVTSLTKDLERATVRDFRDLEGLAPNLMVDAVMGVPGGAAIAIRGVSYQETEKTLDPSIGMIVDGVYLGSGNAGQILDNFDIGRLEVLRGPQGTLFGKNTIGGVINVQRTLPTKELGAKVSGNLGSHGQEDLKAVFNMPLGENSGLKVYGSTLNSDGYIENLAGEDVAGQDYISYGFSILSEPTDDFDIQFTYDFADDETDAGAWANFAGPDYLVCIIGGCSGVVDPDVTTQNDRNYSDMETDSYNLTMNWDVGAGVITSITGYRESEEHTRSEFDASQAALNDVTNNKWFEQFSQEIRFTSQASDNFQYVAGLYYWEADLKQDYVSQDIAFYLDQGAFYVAPDGRYGFANAPAHGIPDTAPGTTVPFGATQIANQTQETTSYAAFIQADWVFAEDWTLTVGGRYTYEEKDYLASQQQILMYDGQFWTPFIGPDAGGAPEKVFFPGEDDWSEFSPKIGVTYDLNEDAIVYASYAEGFKSGGFFGRLADYRIDTRYDPEYVETIEIGYKSTLMDGRAIANVTAFYTDYSDKQEEVIIGGGNTTVQNAADAEMAGVEFEGEMQISAAWSARTAIGYLDSEYKEFENGGVDISHLNPRNAPEWTFSAGTEYVLNVGDGEMAFNLNYRWTDDYDTNLMNSEAGKQKSHETVDASIHYSFLENYRVIVYGRNLTDERTRRVVDIPGLEAFGQSSMGDNYGIEFIANF